MSAYTLSLLADLGALLIALGLLLIVGLVARREGARPAGSVMLGLVVTGACAIAAVVFAVIVLSVLVAG